jgi:hypothetical protein
MVVMMLVLVRERRVSAWVRRREGRCAQVCSCSARQNPGCVALLRMLIRKRECFRRIARADGHRTRLRISLCVRASGVRLGPEKQSARCRWTAAEFEFHSPLVQYTGPLPALLLAMMNSLKLNLAESADWKDGHRGSPRKDSRKVLWTERCRAAAIGNGDDGDLALGLLGRGWPRAESGESARGGA